MSDYTTPPPEVVEAANFLLDNPQFNVLMKFGKAHAVGVMLDGSTEAAAQNLLICQTWDYVHGLVNILSSKG